MTVTGYRLVVPKEWQKIPVQRGTERAISALLDRAFARHGRDQVARYRREVEARLMRSVAEARRNAGVDLFLPLGHRERNLPASFLISYVEFAEQDAPDAGQVLAEVIATTEGAGPTTLGGTPGMRTERTYDADPERGVAYASRRVEYLLPVPGTADSWLLSSFSTLGQGSPDDDVAELLCTLFDAIMSTFRWQYEEQRHDREEA
ncbi:hypothetical protein [Actinacidiphila alni]|uniref:hypothetical protein n=1 Tax=Actinacidiphila alni TaxID=380248 RepID=UPI0034534E6A